MADDAVTVFFSYSHKDESLRDELANHLQILKWNGEITDWHDRKILPGDEWDRQIKDNLNTAHIILLLISSDFIASRYCRDIEIKQALVRHTSGDACVIPVILRRCMWSSAPFGKLQALPKNASPVTDTKTWPTRDDAFTDIAEGIKKVANDIRQRIKADKQTKLIQYEDAYRQALQKQYPLSETVQRELNQLKVRLSLSEADIASIITRLSTQYGEARQKLEQYRNQARLHLGEDGGKISDSSRTILNRFRLIFGLTQEEAAAVEQEELRPYQDKKKATARYTEIFVDTLRNENIISEKSRHQLQRFQSMLELSNAEVQAVEKEEILRLNQEYQQKKQEYRRKLREYSGRETTLSSRDIRDLMNFRLYLKLKLKDAESIEKLELSGHRLADCKLKIEKERRELRPETEENEELRHYRNSNSPRQKNAFIFFLKKTWFLQITVISIWLIISSFLSGVVNRDLLITLFISGSLGGTLSGVIEGISLKIVRPNIRTQEVFLKYPLIGLCFGVAGWSIAGMALGIKYMNNGYEYWIGFVSGMITVLIAGLWFSRSRKVFN